MTIPVYINHEPAGELTISQSGLYTVIEASADAQGLVRLWAHGSGKSVYLGVMEPKDGGLYLCRRFSRRELDAFPAPIESASDREREQTDASHKEAGRKEEVSADCELAAGDLPAADEQGAESERTGESLHNELTDYRACPWPAEPPEDGLLWYRRGDGSLVSFDGVSSLLAIPARLRTAPAQAVERVIEGEKYLVFRY